MIRLSIIVPVYGVDKYIEECICSLYAQDIPQEEYEVICVDDCSLDGSRAIVERLQKEYPTLRLLVHTENKRQGGARNTGLKEAKGTYVWFVDGDDYIKPNCLKRLLEHAEKFKLDVLKFYFDYSNSQQAQRLIGSDVVTTGSDLIFNVQKSASIINRCNSAVQQLIRKEYLIENAITFEEGVQYEDDDYAYQLYAYANRAYLMAYAPYVVRMSPNSTTRRNNDMRRVRDIYAQALRMVKLDGKLAMRDERWHIMVIECIKDCINNCVFIMLKSRPLAEQLRFWCCDRKLFWKLKPYLSRKSYVKLSSYVMWKLLQK